MPPQAMLTEKEELFCQLFSNGGKRFAGNQVETYKQVFGDKENNKLMIESNKLLTSPAVTSRIKDIMTNKMENESYAKVRVLETCSLSWMRLGKRNIKTNGVYPYPLPHYGRCQLTQLKL